MKAPRLAAAFRLAGWFIGGLVGYCSEEQPALGLVAGLLTAVPVAVLGAGSNVLAAVNGRWPLRLPPHSASDLHSLRH
jgi:hypothetical protein